ncbi:MAG: hypothetical protein KKG60_01385 [Nanoarchaeota archaeon]|nr:hypothetical protein [Nanoarchaeota archaeon]
MKFEIDVSGYDIFSKDYVICISGEGSIVKGFKFKKELIETIINNWHKQKYGYRDFGKEIALFKVKLYCVIIYYLFKSIGLKERVSLTICRDFYRHKNDINNTLRYLLEKKLGIQIGSPLHQRLPNSSEAHRYAKLMHNDTLNKLTTSVDINLEDIEKFLRRFVFKRYKKHK